MKFSEIQLHPLLQANLDKVKFIECTPIQDQAIPLLRKGKDISGLAQTGTGKTGAFLIPLIDRILKGTNPDPSVADSDTVPFVDWKKKQFILVLVPTRELAEQVQENAMMFLEGTGMSSVSIYGGTTYEKQIAGLKQGVEFVIATPGRFIDLYKEHVADLGLVRAVVFDEADRMFDMGFKDDMKFVLKRMPRDRQFLVFSATLNFEVLNVAYEHGAEPVEINISRDQAKADNVKDFMAHVGQQDKPRILLSLIKKYNPRQAIIFSNFKHNVERIATFLTNNGVPAMGISSLLTQAQRNRVMAQFKAENDRNILVATDVAARGLDILGVDVVINFDLPDDAENYVHRIGRTGRAGQTGQAFSMVGDRDVDALQRVEEFLGNKIEVLWLDDAEIVTEMKPFPRDEHRGPPKRPSGGGGGRFDKRDDRPRGGGGEGRGPRPPRNEGKGPRPDRPRDDRPRDDRPRGDRPRGPGGPNDRPAGDRPQQARSGGSDRGPRRDQHRDRNSGRHRDPNAPVENQQSGNAQARPNQGGHPPRRDQPRGGQPRNRQGGSRSDSRRHQQSGQRPQGGGSTSRPIPRSAGAQGGANKGIAGKVSGLFKKIFGK